MSVFTRALPKLPILQKHSLKISLIISQCICAVFCGFAAFGTMFGTMSPLALCFAAAFSPLYSLSACMGAVAGYALALPDDSSAPYLICILLIGIFKAFIPASKIQSFSKLLFYSISVSVCFLISSLIFTLSASGTFSDILLIIAQTLIIFGMSYLLRTALSTPLHNTSNLSSQEKASLLLFVISVLICFGPFEFFGLNLMHILGAGVALIGVINGRSQYGTLIGVAVSVAFVISNFNSLYAGFAISVACLVSGFFVKENRFIVALAFIISCLLGLPLAGEAMMALLFIVEVSLGCAIVMALPLTAITRIPISSSNFVGRPSLTVLSGRLRMISSALASVGTTLNSVCDKLPRYGETYSDICDAVTHAVCRKCPKNTVCWGSGSGDVYDAFNNMQSILQTRGYVLASDIPEPLKHNCSFPKKLTSALSAGYKMGSQKKIAAARNKATRAALTEQYSAMASALSQLATQVYREEMPDKRKEKKAERLFCSLGIEPIEINISTDAYGCTHADIQIQRTIFTKEELSALTKDMSSICHCKFQNAVIENMYASTYVHFVQEHLFNPVFGAFTLPAKTDDISADVCKTFTDYQGCAHAILCDGMGTGEQAALDGNLAAILSEKLMIAGFAANEAARLVNVALSLKGDDDTCATLDAFSVNLFSGKAQIFKAGAAASFLVRQGIVTILDGESLPIGILGKVTGKASSMQLQLGDVIVLISDGVMSVGTKRICAMLTAAENMHPKVLAKRLVQEARMSAQRPDDITVICMQLDRVQS